MGIYLWLCGNVFIFLLCLVVVVIPLTSGGKAALALTNTFVYYNTQGMSLLKLGFVAAFIA